MPQVATLRSALRRSGYSTSEDGTLLTLGAIDLETGNRSALDEQIDRLRRSTGDPAQLIGSAKDLLEAVARFVLEELSFPVSPHADFGQLWYLARERLGVRPEDVIASQTGSDQVRKILGASWTIAEQVNGLRNLVGTGHGRTLPTALSAEAASSWSVKRAPWPSSCWTRSIVSSDDDASRERLGRAATENCRRGR